MKIISKTLKLLPLFLMVLVVTGCDDDDNTFTTTNIVDIALANNLTSLAAALQATDLVSTLQMDGPFTVFAPTNEAFDDLLGATGLDLANLSQAEEDVVRNILLNHVIIGENISSADIIAAGAGYESTGATGPDNANLSLYYRVVNGAVVINGSAQVANADITASNGVIHIVNEVIPLPTVVTFATADPTFSTLVTALTTETPATNFAAVLSRTEAVMTDDLNPDFTVFAPTNDAFQALLDSNMDWNTLADIDDALLTNVLLYHVIGGTNVRSTDLNPNGDTVPTTLLGQTVTITLPGTNGNIADINDSGIIAVDVQAINGVIHVINGVLLPTL